MVDKQLLEPEDSRRQDEKIFHDGEAIFNEQDLRGLINDVYAGYQYRCAQLKQIDKLINFLALEINRFRTPVLADQSSKMSDYLTSFRDFLETNFQRGKPAEDGDTVCFLKTQAPGFETEAFLMEFQMLAMDVEKAYRDYQTAVNSFLEK